MIIADDEQLGRFADLRAIAFGRDAFAAQALPQRAAERLRRLSQQRRLVARPPDRVAQRADFGLARAGACSARDVHPHRALGFARECVALRREIDIPGRFGRNGGTIVSGEHAAQETHGHAV